MVEALSIIALVAVVTLIVTDLVIVFTVMRDRRRREHHPRYFKYFDKAMEIRREIHEQTQRKREYFESRLKLIYDYRRSGEGTEEYFSTCSRTISKEYLEFQEWFNEQHKSADRLFEKADLYAKEHGLKWGVLF